MEWHVWAVWDFMSLLKSLQAEIAPVRIPWVPPGDPELARLINEIVLGEESDEGPDGRYASHFESYVAAMKVAGAQAGPIMFFAAGVANADAPENIIERLFLPSMVQTFVTTTLGLCRASLPERVAAFTIGREEIIPSMFTAALRELPQQTQLKGFIWYLERHVTLDGDRHGPLAGSLFERICLRDAQTRTVALKAAILALEMRVALWNSAVADLDKLSQL